MFPTPESPLSFAKILGGLSNSLNIAKRVIPLYESTKPMISNAKSAYMKLTNKDQPSLPTQKKTTIKRSQLNNPTFFK